MRRTGDILPSCATTSITNTAVMGAQKVSSREETPFLEMGDRFVSVDSALCGRRYSLRPQDTHVALV